MGDSVDSRLRENDGRFYGTFGLSGVLMLKCDCPARQPLPSPYAEVRCYNQSQEYWECSEYIRFSPDALKQF